MHSMGDVSYWAVKEFSFCDCFKAWLQLGINMESWRKILVNITARLPDPEFGRGEKLFKEDVAIYTA